MTLIEGEGELRVGEGPVRTGVTVILPRGAKSKDPVFAGWFSLNGNGEMTGTAWVEESGFLEGHNRKRPWLEQEIVLRLPSDHGIPHDADAARAAERSSVDVLPMAGSIRS